MADKELRKMNRTELIEIIYALQQNEKTLREQNEQLRWQLEEKILRMEQSGSIAEAALSLNHIFEDAEAAAQQYLRSIREKITEADQILNQARKRADAILRSAQEEAETEMKEIRFTDD